MQASLSRPSGLHAPCCCLRVLLLLSFKHNCSSVLLILLWERQAGGVTIQPLILFLPRWWWCQWRQWLCLYVCVHRCVQVHRHVHAEARRWFFTLVLETGSLTERELGEPTRLAHQWVPGMLLPLLPLCWSCHCGQHFTLCFFSPVSPLLPSTRSLFPLNFVCSFPKLPESTECCLYVHRCRTISWNMGSLPGATFLKKLLLPFPASITSSSFLIATRSILGFCQDFSCARHPSSCEFVCAASLLYLDNTALL